MMNLMKVECLNKLYMQQVESKHPCEGPIFNFLSHVYFTIFAFQIGL